MGVGLVIGSLIAGSGLVLLIEGLRAVEVPVIVPPEEEIPVEVIIEPGIEVVIPDPGEVLITQVGF